MSLSWVDWDVEDVTVIMLTGRITLGEGTARLRQAIQEVLDRGRRKLILDLHEVQYIDSSGLGELVHSYNRIKSNAGQLKLMKLQQLARDLMQVTRLYTVFEVYDDQDSAIRSIQAAA